MSQCNFCGYIEPHSTGLRIGALPHPVVPCDFCGSQICSGCRPNHEVGCRSNAQKKTLGIGLTVSAVPYEHRAGHVVPETTPPDRRERVLAMPAVLGASYDLTLEPNEGPWTDYDATTGVGGAETEKMNTVPETMEIIHSESEASNEVQSDSTNVLQPEQDTKASSVFEGGDGRNVSPEGDSRSDRGNVSDESGNSDNRAVTSESKIEMVDPATADGE